MPTGQQLVQLALTQMGERYVFGAEARPSDPNPNRWDCSELVEWVCARTGVNPKVPDGAFYQWKHCRPISVGQAAGIPGALLFFGDGTGVGRSAITHVIFSRGNGTSAEARSSKYGTGSWPIAGRPFRYAGLIPGVDYSNKGPVTRPTLPNLGTVDLKAIAGAITMCKKGSILKLGDNNDCVKWLQAGINNRSGRGLTVDGVFGLSTLAAVRDLQDWFNIGIDGVVGPKTWALVFP
jgi:cell wall-associated NlpC family hydrolase